MADVTTNRPNILFVDTFDVKGKKHKVTLTTSSISWEPDATLECTLLCVIPLREVVAAVPCDCTLDRNKCDYCLQRRRRRHYRLSSSSSELSPLHVQSFRLFYASRSGRHLWKTKDIIFRGLCNGGVAREWIRSLNDALRRLPVQRPRKLLVFVNPYGGKKAAPRLYRKKVSPLLLLAGIHVHMVETERANHALDYLQDVDLSKYDGVVCVGGDGMFGELLNGLLLRTQRDAGVDVHDVSSSLSRPKVVLGVIPAGSTDAVVYGTTGVNDVVTSTLQIVLGHRVGLDVCGLHGRGGALLRYATSFLSYGYFGDTLVESEKYRWMGPSRYDISGMKVFLRQKVYEGELAMEVVSFPENPWKENKCTLGCGVCSGAQKQKSKVQNKESNDNNSRWVTLRGRFKAINVATMSCRCGMSKEGISPTAHLGDGCTDVVLVGDCTAFGYLRYLLRTALALGSPFELNFVQFYRVRQFRFTPSTNGSEEMQPIAGDSVSFKKTSVWNCDGEVISEPAIQARVHCQLVNVFASGIEDRPDQPLFSCCLP